MTQLEKITELRRYTELPDGLTVVGSLNLCYTGIRELPDGLTVEGSLSLSRTGITELPDGLTVKGSLILNHTNIKELPDNLTVGGSLDLCYTDIKELPDGLAVGGILFLSDTNIRSNSNYFISNRIGSRSDKTIFYIKKNVIKCGCFSGTLEQFITKVNETYGVGSKYGIEYDKFINKCKKII